MIEEFPNPRHTTPEGILAIGGDLEPESLILAYRQGIFPWPMEGYPLVWFCPPERAILDFDRIHIPKSLERQGRKSPFTFTHNRDFQSVIQACSETPRPGQAGTWITPEMIEAYIELHRLGIAQSIEAWDGDHLVGGVYGVEVEGVFSAESMFYRKSGASKLALLHLVELLKARGQHWLDIQVMTPHLKALGAREIPREEFLRLLAVSQKAQRLRTGAF